MKAVIFSHAHPIFSKGGGELAAYYLWQGIDNHPEHQAWFIGRADQRVMHKFSSLASVGERNYLIAGNADIAKLSATTDIGPDSDLAQLLKSIQPDVIHFHHYVHIGIELIRLVKRICPDVRIILTLHEYIAICMNNGQMVKTDGRLCYSSSPRECHLCFPHITPEDLFLREQWIKSFFNLVDVFISPSEFLRDRYISWGLKEECIKVIENGLPKGDKVPLRIISKNEKRTRFAYFGQINPFKGVDVILEAIDKLPNDKRELINLDIFGSALELQSPEFQRKINRLLEELEGTVHLHGPYEPHEMPVLMKEVDWIVMGSVWWENSPLVIQEAFKFGRPIITPDIGGMAEKVVPGIGGLNYRARDVISLSNLLESILEDDTIHDKICRKIPKYPDIENVVLEHLKEYQEELKYEESR